VDFDSGPEFDRFKLEEAQNSEALLLGRVTYEAMQAFWPTAEGEYAERLNELPKYIVSSTLTDPPWNATVLGDDWPEEVARLRKRLEGEILVYGSRRFSQAPSRSLSKGSVRAIPGADCAVLVGSVPRGGRCSRLVVGGCLRHQVLPVALGTARFRSDSIAAAVSSIHARVARTRAKPCWRTYSG
jgi:hypothetical protein